MRLTLFSVGLVQITASAKAAQFFFDGNENYFSAADIPSGFYAGGTPTALEDFEDGSLDFGITASSGILNSAVSSASTDSVDADDGVIDGSGTNGDAWRSTAALSTLSPTAVRFTFPTLVTAAGLVWTDGAHTPLATFEFEAFGPGLQSLGIIGPVDLSDGTNFGSTGEDRFFGVHDSQGIVAIEMRSSLGAFEVDHVQYGSLPEPSTFSLALLGFFGCTRRRRL